MDNSTNNKNKIFDLLILHNFIHFMSDLLNLITSCHYAVQEQMQHSPKCWDVLAFLEQTRIKTCNSTNCLNSFCIQNSSNILYWRQVTIACHLHLIYCLSYPSSKKTIQSLQGNLSKALDFLYELHIVTRVLSCFGHFYSTIMFYYLLIGFRTAFCNDCDLIHKNIFFILYV